jgi:CRP-like cAMP-binding protein
MKNRFEGPDGKRLLLDALKDQSIVSGNETLAEEIAGLGSFVPVSNGSPIITQGADDNDVYLILLGAFAIIVNGKQVNVRRAGTHLGEMAAIQPTQCRSATVTALEDSILLKLTEPQVAALGEKHPSIFRQFAKELARRLEQRNALVTAAHSKVHVFIMSSVEALQIARAVQNAFEHDPFNVVV